MLGINSSINRIHLSFTTDGSDPTNILYMFDKPKFLYWDGEFVRSENYRPEIVYSYLIAGITDGNFCVGNVDAIDRINYQDGFRVFQFKNDLGIFTIHINNLFIWCDGTLPIDESAFKFVNSLDKIYQGYKDID